MRSPLDLRVNARIGALHLHAEVTLETPWTVLFGPSGSGKSSLLRLIAGLWTPPDHDLFFGPKDLKRLVARDRHIALIAQRPALFPHMTVRENVLFAAGYSAISGSRPWDAADELLTRFHLQPLAEKRPSQISGGEQQRVALARAIASKPRILLLDEVFTGLNAPLRAGLIADLQAWQTRTRAPIVSVTHDVAEALATATEVVKIEAGEIVAQGEARLLLAPECASLLAQLGAS